MKYWKYLLPVIDYKLNYRKFIQYFTGGNFWKQPLLTTCGTATPTAILQGFEIETPPTVYNLFLWSAVAVPWYSKYVSLFPHLWKILTHSRVRDGIWLTPENLREIYAGLKVDKNDDGKNGDYCLITNNSTWILKQLLRLK